MSTQDLDGRDCTDEATLADGEFDAAEIDKELISSRLRQDVLEHSGKIYRFIASSVRLFVTYMIILLIPLSGEDIGPCFS